MRLLSELSNRELVEKYTQTNTISREELNEEMARRFLAYYNSGKIPGTDRLKDISK